MNKSPNLFKNHKILIIMINIANPVEKLQSELAHSKETLEKLTQQDQKLDSNIK